MAPEKIENILTQSSFIAQAFVYGDSLQSALVAVFIPDEEPVRNHLKSIGETSLAEAPFSDICKSANLHKVIKEDIPVVSQAGGLHGFEIPKAFHLDCEMFSVDNGILTPTMKLKRQQALEKYQKEIEKLYAELNQHTRSNL